MIIGRQTHHLARLVDDLLDVARVTTGRIVVERQPVALGDVTRRALQAFEAAGKTAQHEIVLKTESVWVIGDASRLEQVVANLLDNALRYTARRSHHRQRASGRRRGGAAGERHRSRDS